MPRERIGSFEVWFGTPDAPAPSNLQTESEPEIRVGVAPLGDTAIVHVRHRRAGGPWQRWRLAANQIVNETHYFTGRFPQFPAGTEVEYEVYVRSDGIPPTPERRVGDGYTYKVAPSFRAQPS